jgi:hypothetical protein
MYLQKRAVLPTDESPIIIILYLGSLPEEKYRSSIINVARYKYQLKQKKIKIKQN